jgi:hypothetical protein
LPVLIDLCSADWATSVIAKVMGFGLLCFDKDGSINRGELEVARKRHRCLSQKILFASSRLFRWRFTRDPIADIDGGKRAQFQEREQRRLQISPRSGSLAKLGNFGESGVVGVYWKAAAIFLLLRVLNCRQFSLSAIGFRMCLLLISCTRSRSERKSAQEKVNGQMRKTWVVMGKLFIVRGLTVYIARAAIC